MNVETIWPTLLVAACVAAAGLDMYSRKLPNLLCLATLLVGLVYAGFSSGWAGVGWHSAHAAAALLIGMALFAGGLIGGGDAKFYAAAAAWFPLADGLRLLMAVSVAGLVTVLVWIAIRRILRRPWRRQSANDPFAQFPYGVAIGIGAISAFL